MFRLVAVAAFVMLLFADCLQQPDFSGHILIIVYTYAAVLEKLPLREFPFSTVSSVLTRVYCSLCAIESDDWDLEINDAECYARNSLAIKMQSKRCILFYRHFLVISQA